MLSVLIRNASFLQKWELIVMSTPDVPSTRDARTLSELQNYLVEEKKTSYLDISFST